MVDNYIYFNISKSNSFACLAKSNQRSSEDWVYTLNFYESSKVCPFHEVFLEITIKASPQGTTSISLALLSFFFFQNKYVSCSPFFSLFPFYSYELHFFSFLFDFIMDADYKQQQWFRSSWKQNIKVVKHMLHML